MTIPRGESAASLRFLIDELMADGTLDDDDLATIAQATAAAREKVAADKAWAETAHVHDEPHRTEVTVDEHGHEDVDASGVTCCDCGRALVSDAGSLRILVCPRLHGRRGSLRPTDPDGAVECGRG